MRFYFKFLLRFLSEFGVLQLVLVLHQPHMAHKLLVPIMLLFNCYNGMNDAPKFNPPSTSQIVPSLEVVEDPSWYINTRALSHITNDSGKLFDLKPYLGS